jgi:CBS domain-containing protein
VRILNILFFLTPKKDVAYLDEKDTMRQALEKMEYHRYTSIPIIDNEGKYLGTITEGDLLWSLKNSLGLDLKSTENILIREVPRRMDNKPVSINANIDDLIYTAMHQNFVPVIDDQNVFIGIIKRSDIIQYCYKKMYEKNLEISYT